MKYYVDQKAAFSGNGSKKAPFQCISQAASVAAPGDVVYVLPGIYREWVDPQNAGTVGAALLIALGINAGNTIIVVIGGFCAGIYNSMVYDTRR